MELTFDGSDLTPARFSEIVRDRDCDSLVIWNGPPDPDFYAPLAAMSWLRQFTLGESMIDDRLFVHLHPLESLEFLNLAYTNIAGDFSILSAQPLREVRLEGCRRVGDACARSLAAIPTLRNIEIHMTGLTDAGLAALATLPLEVLWLGPRVTDAGMRIVAGIPSLRHLDVCAHMVTDEGVAALADLKALQNLWLTRCAITDASIHTLTGLQSLLELNVDATGITAAGLARLRKALPQCLIAEPEADPEMV